MFLGSYFYFLFSQKSKFELDYYPIQNLEFNTRLSYSKDDLFRTKPTDIFFNIHVKSQDDENSSFFTQVKRKLHSDKIKNFKNVYYTFQTKVKRSVLTQKKQNKLVFYYITGDWDFYLDDLKLASGRDSPDSIYQKIDLSVAESLKVKDSATLKWVVKNPEEQGIYGIMFDVGIKLRTTQDAALTEKIFFLKNIQLAMACALGLFLIFLHSLYQWASIPTESSSAFSFFTCSMSINCFINSYVFSLFKLYYNDKLYFIVLLLASSLVCISTTFLLVSSFKFSKKIKLLFVIIVLLRTIYSFIIYYKHYMTERNLEIYADYFASIWQSILFIFIISAILGFFFLIKDYLKLKTQGLTPRIPTLITNGVWTAAFTVMCWFMVNAFVNWSPNDDNFAIRLALGTVPAFLMLWMQSYPHFMASRKSEKTASMRFLKHEFFEFYKSNITDVSFHVCFFIIDIKGYKKLTQAFSASNENQSQLRSLLEKLSQVFLKMIPKERYLFDFKSNGDEFMIAIYGKDSDDIKKIYRSCLNFWSKIQAELLIQFRNDVMKRLIWADAQTTVSPQDIDLHAMCFMDSDVKITLISDRHSQNVNLDIFSQKYTVLSEAFKESHASKVGVFKEDLVSSKSNNYLDKFSPLNSVREEIGHISFILPQENHENFREN